MKKMIIALLAVCLLAAGALGFLASCGEKSGTVTLADSVVTAAPAQDADASGPSDADASAQDAEAYQLRVPDYEAMYALHEPDEVVAAVDGKDVTWGELFYLYFSQAKQIETYFSNMAAYYGAAPDWDSQISEDSDRTFADSVAEGAESTLKEICAIEGLAAQSKVELSDEQLAAIRTQEEQDIAGAVGENGTEEDFNAYIKTIFLPRTLYDRMNRINFLYRQSFVQAYGENGELVEDEAAVRYLTDNNYLAATHILLMTIDPDTFKALDEEDFTMSGRKDYLNSDHDKVDTMWVLNHEADIRP